MGISGSDPYVTEARAGIARAGATRSNGYSVFNVVTVINGVDRSSAVLKGSMSISQALNDEPDTARFTLRSTAGFVPQAGDLVTLALGAASNAEFGGQIASVTRRYVRGIAHPYIDVECVDYLALLDRRLVLAEYTGQSISAIAVDIIDRYTTGFTRLSVADGLPTIDYFPATNETVSNVLKRLANAAGGGFYVDADRDIHLFGASGDLSPKAGTNPQQLTDGLTSWKAFQHISHDRQLRTRDIVEGKNASVAGTVAAGSTIVPLQPGTTLGWATGTSGIARAGTQRITYTNLRAPSTVTGSNPTAATVLRSAAAAGAATLDLDSSAVFLGVSNQWIQAGGQYLFVTAISGDNHTVSIRTSGSGALSIALPANEPVYLLPQLEGVAGLNADLGDGDAVVLRIETDDAAAQATMAAVEGDDGVHEHIIQDGRLSADGATARAAADLAAFASPLTSIEWETEDINARPGRTQSVNFDGLSEDLLITRSEIAFPRPNALPRRQCEASGVKTSTLYDAALVDQT